MDDAWPLVTRELQEEARRSFSYWSRVLSAGIVVAAFAFTSLTLNLPSSQHGRYLFGHLNSALSLAIWTLVPVLTADCISREKREGTLGLLFLTPLSPHDIIGSKAVVHGIRAATLVLAAVPVVGLPIILGGVGWAWALYAANSQLSALLLALAAGLIASVRNTEWIRSLVKAELLSGCFALLLMWLQPFSTVHPLLLVFIAIVAGLRFAESQQSRTSKLPPFISTYDRLTASTVLRAPGLPTWNRHSARAILWALAILASWIWTPLGPLTTAVLIFGFAVNDSARWVKTHWQKELTAPPQPLWVKVFSTSEFWQSMFRWNKGRTLDRNPIAWLQEYSWTARLTKWGWCIIAVLGEFVALGADPNFTQAQGWLSALVVIGIAFTACGSFRREMESGALELLLVAPLRPRHLIGGRLWGIWGHFLPAVAVLSSFWLMTPYKPDFTSSVWKWFGATSFLCLPAIGLYFSLRRMNFLVAWLATCAVGLVLPAAAMMFFLRSSAGSEIPIGLLCGLQALAAGLAAWKLLQSLHRRTFLTGYAA